MSPVGSFAEPGAADLALPVHVASSRATYIRRCRRNDTMGQIADMLLLGRRASRTLRSSQRQTECFRKNGYLSTANCLASRISARFTVSITCQANDFAKVGAGLVVVSYRFSRLSGSRRNRAPAPAHYSSKLRIRSALSSVTLFQQKIGEQLAHVDTTDFPSPRVSRCCLRDPLPRASTSRLLPCCLLRAQANPVRRETVRLPAGPIYVTGFEALNS